MIVFVFFFFVFWFGGPMTDASVGGLVERWRTEARVAGQFAVDPGTEPDFADDAASRALVFTRCADELEAALPDLLYAAGEHASIKALLSDANIEGLTVYQQVETLVAARPVAMPDDDEAEILAAFKVMAFNIASSTDVKAPSQVEWEIVEAQKSAYGLGAARTAGGWQEIATAPKDGTPVLGFNASWGVMRLLKWSDPPGAGDPAWRLWSGEQILRFSPTHWMPLPSAPTETT